MKIKKYSIPLFLIISINYLLLRPVWPVPLPVISAHKNTDGVTLKLKKGYLQLQVFSPRIIRVVYRLDKTAPENKSFVVIAKPGQVHWKLTNTPITIRLRTDLLEVRVNRATGVVGFYDITGNPVLVEKTDGG